MAFLTNWNYRKKITITGQTNAGSGYQVKLLVGESSGASGSNFHVEGHSNSFPSDKNVSGDLRFTSSDGNTLLPFWVESVSGTTPNRLATIWVKVSADLGTNQNIYCYYGGNTTNVSNGDNTFIFFDDFDTTSVDTNKWTVTSGGISHANSEAYPTSTSNPIDQMNTSGKVSVTTDANRGIASRFNIRRTGRSDTYFCFAEDDSNIIQCGNTSYKANGVYTYGAGRYNLSQIGLGNNASGDYIYEQRIVGTAMTMIQTSGLSCSRTLPNTVNGRTFHFRCGGGDVNYPMNYINFVAVRRFIATEPAFNTVGSEETGTTGTMIKRWNGTAWEKKPLKRYNGSEWENVTIKRYNGSSWDEL